MTTATPTKPLTFADIAPRKPVIGVHAEAEAVAQAVNARRVANSQHLEQLNAELHAAGLAMPDASSSTKRFDTALSDYVKLCEQIDHAARLNRALTAANRHARHRVATAQRTCPEYAAWKRLTASAKRAYHLIETSADRTWPLEERNQGTNLADYRAFVERERSSLGARIEAGQFVEPERTEKPTNARRKRQPYTPSNR